MATPLTSNGGDHGIADPIADAPSKSRRKREMHALQRLGVTLLALDAARLARIALPDKLREAIVEAKSITAREGRRRQLQYIGKLMRLVDCAEIQRELDDATGDSRSAVALMHRCERLRDALLADNAALTEFIADHPQLDVQHLDVQKLRATIRSARREHAQGCPPRHVRELYRWLHDALSDKPAAIA